MEGHSEFTALLLPELAVSVGASAPPKLPAAPTENALSEFDFLALLEQELARPASSPPSDAPQRQILPAGGQTLPLPAPPLASAPSLSAPLPSAPAQQQLLLAGQRPAPGIQQVPDSERPTTAPGRARPAAVAPSLSTVGSEVRDLRPAPTQLVAAVDRHASQVERVLSPPELSSVPVRPLISPPAAPRPARASPVELPASVSSGVEVSRDPGLARGSAEVVLPQVDAKQPVSTLGERLDFLPSARSDPGSAATGSAPAPIAPPIVSTSASATDAFGPMPRHAEQHIPAALPENIVDSVRSLSDQKGGEMRLRLNPPELGYLEIKVSVSDEQTFVSITANNSNARDVLEQHIGRLKTLLDASGLSLADAQVSSQGQPKQGHAEALPEWAMTDAEPAVSTSTTSARAITTSHQIDLFA